MQRLDDFVALVKSGFQALPGHEDVGKLCADFVKELKKSSPADLDNVLNNFDPTKHAHGVAVVLSAKAANSNCSLEKLLKQSQQFLAVLEPKFTKNFDAHQLYLFMKHLTERLVKDNAAISGLELVNMATILAGSGNPYRLTEIHSLFLQLCIESSHMRVALDHLNTEIHELPAYKNCDLISCVNYFVFASTVLSSYGYFISAITNIETLFYFPNIVNVSTPVVVEAYKKFILLSILTDGRASALPKSILTQLDAGLKKNVTAYIAVQEAFSADGYNFHTFNNLITLHMPTFVQDGNVELAQHCVRKYKIRELTKFAKVFENIHISTVMERLNFEDMDALESHLLDMAVHSDRIGRLNMETGTITFSRQSSNKSTERLLTSLQNAMTEMNTINEVMSAVDSEIISSPEYLRKSVPYGDPMGREYMMHEMGGYMGGHMEHFATSGNGSFGFGMPEPGRGARPGRRSP